MSTTEFTHVSEPGLIGGSRIIAPLSDEMLDKSHALQEAYSDEFGNSHLHLPHRTELNVTFARLIIPEPSESAISVNSRIEAMRPTIASALNRTVELNGEPFEVAAAFDTLEAIQSEVMIVAPDNGHMNQLRRLFTAGLQASMYESVPTTLSVTPVQFAGELPMPQVEAFTNSLKKYFTPVKTTFTSLQLVREARPGQLAKIIEEFPARKKL
ncbi:MAG: hypothetical protein JWN26_447 [Candidatus Saccharibacteria bacterium]|nr:hypothetical protein [Candidatus Saccharibacteria bacterium]